MLARQLRHAVHVGPGHLDGAVEIAAELLAAFARAAAHHRAEIEPFGIGGDERLGKDGQLRSLTRRLRDEVAQLVERSRAIERHRSCLHDRRADLHRFTSLAARPGTGGRDRSRPPGAATISSRAPAAAYLEPGRGCRTSCTRRSASRWALSAAA